MILRPTKAPEPKKFNFIEDEEIFDQIAEIFEEVFQDNQDQEEKKVLELDLEKEEELQAERIARGRKAIRENWQRARRAVIQHVRAKAQGLNEDFMELDLKKEEELQAERIARGRIAIRENWQRARRAVIQHVRAKAQGLNEDFIDCELQELFFDCSVRLPQDLIEEMKEFVFYELSEFSPTFIRCKICLSLAEDYYELDCKHRYCVACYRLFCYSLLDSCKIMTDDVCCPECTVKIPDLHFFRFFGHEDLDRISKLRFKIKGQILVAQKKAVSCPVPDCPGYAHLLKDEKITACCKCRCTLCALCGLGVHPGISCEENLGVGIDESLEKLILSQNWKKCPTCGVAVEKIDGCQFLYCSSLICKGKNNLCYLCGRFVIEAQHFSHYQTKGPYGDSCNTLDGLPEDIDPALLVPNLVNNEPQPFPNEEGEE